MKSETLATVGTALAMVVLSMGMALAVVHWARPSEVLDRLFSGIERRLSVSQTALELKSALHFEAASDHGRSPVDSR
jgi:hypothetical protein